MDFVTKKIPKYWLPIHYEQQSTVLRDIRTY